MIVTKDYVILYTLKAKYETWIRKIISILRLTQKGIVFIKKSICALKFNRENKGRWLGISYLSLDAMQG